VCGYIGWIGSFVPKFATGLEVTLSTQLKYLGQICENEKQEHLSMLYLGYK